MKILIYKEKLEEELNKLGQYTSYDEWEQGRKTGKMEVLESILQQGEEYNENEAIEFLFWYLNHPSIEYYKKLNNFYYRGKYCTIQELYKIYKDARSNKKEK